MASVIDGAATSLFAPVAIKGNATFSQLVKAGAGKAMADVAAHAPSGKCVNWGIPFTIARPVVIKDRTVTVKVHAFRAQWVVFQHASAPRPLPVNRDGFVTASRGKGQLGEHAADYVIVYADGSEERVPIRRRYEVADATRDWGENCLNAVPHHKPHPIRAHHETMIDDLLPGNWGISQTRTNDADRQPWMNWLFAWENPHPRKQIAAIRFEPVSGALVISAVSQGNCSSTPVRWESRCKAMFALPRGVEFEPDMDDHGQLAQLALDLGQVISATPRPIYPDRSWARTYNNRVPEVSDRQIIVEYAAHPDASFYLRTGKTCRKIPVAKVKGSTGSSSLKAIAPATQTVTLRTIDKASRKPVPVKLHVHGKQGEYLPPIDRHRLPNPGWFEDYSIDFLHLGTHWCTYVPGETVLKLPLGRVYIEVSKGFEIRPVRKVVNVTRATDRIDIKIEKVLPWREQGWASADTHVHFLSPQSAMLEGSGEGVNVVNLLASQWGELMTNVGDFDGRTTHGARREGSGTESASDGEFLVRVGTENRMQVLGHISLLGYSGQMIHPLCTGGPSESAIGDPQEVTMADWAQRCIDQKGLVVMPHGPNPQCERAADVVLGVIHAMEMMTFNPHDIQISPYGIADWYRYQNLGYQLPLVGGSDKMGPAWLLGGVRTYTQLGDRTFTYESWMDATRAGHTFVTVGPLVDMQVEDATPGTSVTLPESGGTVTVSWRAESVRVPISAVEVVVGGRTTDVHRPTDPMAAQGTVEVSVTDSTWIAVRVRGGYDNRTEDIAAHTSAVQVLVGSRPIHASDDALEVLKQIEGAMAFIDTIAARPEADAYRKLRLTLESAWTRLHQRMHQNGDFHEHSPLHDHAEHHEH